MNLKHYTKFKLYALYFLSFTNRGFINFVLKNSKISKSQVYQDLFVIFYSGLKRKGKFIEIGGGNGIDLSNSYLLESKFGWKGIICEPDKRSNSKILNNRKAKLDKRGLSNECRKQVFFYESKDPYLSSLEDLNIRCKKYKIDTVCLNCFFNFYKLKNIDYISIDTEGNELDIIKNFKFEKFKVDFFTIEHNFNKKIREEIFKIMKKNGYRRVYKYLSYMDDWYISKRVSLNDH